MVKKTIFEKRLTNSMDIDSDVMDPSEFENIELICFEYMKNGYDLMYAYNSVKEEGCLFLGYYQREKLTQ